jgi:DegV family protein with EDD domain
MKVAIVTDSTADIPVELLESNHIEIVPNLIIIDGKSFIDNREISRIEFYERLPQLKALPTTATASSGEYLTLYEKLFKQGFDHILSIHASQLLSGIFNAASGAAQVFGDKVRVIDSGQVTMSLGWMVLAASEDAANHLSLDEILEHMADIHRRVRLIAMLDTLEYVKRSGRVSWARASLGSLLQIKPFIELREGVVMRTGEARTRQKALERLLDMLHAFGPLERLAVLHTNAETDARSLLAQIKQKLAYPPLVINATPIIGTHVGPNCLGFAVVVQ